jgi:hypothetical protein
MNHFDYLIKQATLPKQAGRWDRKIADIIRANPTGQVAKFIGHNPENYSRMDLRDTIKSILMKREAVDRRKNWERIDTNVAKLYTQNQSSGTHNSKLYRKNSDNILDNLYRGPGVESYLFPVTDHYNKVNLPNSHVPVIEKILGDIRHGAVPEIRRITRNTNKKYYNPEEYVYKGVKGSLSPASLTGTSAVRLNSDQIFASPHIAVARDYSGPNGYIFKLKTPQDALFTPQLAVHDRVERIKDTKNNVIRFKHMLGSHLSDYETVIDYNPKDLLSVYRVDRNKFIPQGIRQKDKIVPFTSEALHSNPIFKSVTEYEKSPVLR